MVTPPPPSPARARSAMRGRVAAFGFRAQRVIANAAVDLRYGSLLTFHRRPGDGLFSSVNSDYAALEHIFADRIEPHDTLVDVGCGGGRVINFWLRRGLRNRMIGIEADQDIARRTRRRLRRFPNVEIVTGDATSSVPPDGTLFYMFNPFGREPLAEFVEQLEANDPERPGRPMVIYYNCKHLDVFDSGRWTVERPELRAPDHTPLSPLAVVTRSHAR